VGKIKFKTYRGHFGLDLENHIDGSKLKILQFEALKEGLLGPLTSMIYVLNILTTFYRSRVFQ
jgi:hypothetical protein